MATTSGKHPLTVEMESLLECSVCLERFVNPRVLPCQHTFCLKCLERHVRTTFNNVFRTFYCPECRKRHGIPRGGVEQFPTNFLMNKLGDIHDGKIFTGEASDDPKLARTGPKCANSTAENEHGEAISHCSQCSENFCKECHDWHQKFKATRDHVLIDIDKVPKSLKCATHSGRDLNKFCQRCNVAVCVVCPELPGLHYMHPCIDIATATTSYRSDFDKSIASIKKHLQYLQDLPHEMTETENKVKVDAFSARQNILTTIDLLCRMIREHGQHLIQQVSSTEQEALAKATDIRSQQLSRLLHFQGLQSNANRLNELNGAQFVMEVISLKAEVRDLLRTPLQKMKWQSTLSYKEGNGLKETLGKVHKHQSSDVTSLEQSPTPGTSSAASDSDVAAQLRLQQVIPVEVTRLSITGIAVALNHIFLTHEGNPHVWAYTKEGAFVKSLGIHGIVECSGIAAMNADGGRLVVSDNCAKHLHWLLLSTTPTIRIVEQGSTPVTGAYYGLTADSNNYVVLTTRQPYNLWVYEPDVTNYAMVAFAGSIRMDQVREPCCAIRTSVGFAAFSSRHKEVVFVDDYGRRESECRLRLAEHDANATAGDMCLGNAPDPVIFMADRSFDYIHIVGLEGGRSIPCALNREVHGIYGPRRVTWDQGSRSLLVAQHKENGPGYEIRVFGFTEMEAEPIQKEEITSVVMNLELPKMG